MAGPRFDPSINLGHVLTIIALLGGGVSVYAGVFQTLTELVVRVDELDKRTDKVPEHDKSISLNASSIAELRRMVEDSRRTNEALLIAVNGIRIDLTRLQSRNPTVIIPPQTEN